MSDGERKSGLEEVDGKTKQGFEQERPNHEAAKRDEKARGGVDAEWSNSIERRFQDWVRLNRVRLNNQTDDWNHHREPQNLDDTVDENTQKHQDRLLPLACVEQLVSPPKD